MLLVILLVLLLVAAGLFIWTNVAGTSVWDLFRSRSGSSATMAGTGDLSAFVLGSWGPEGDCRNAISFEAGQRFVVAGEDPGGGFIDTVGGRPIMRVTVDGETAEAWLDRQGDTLVMESYSATNPNNLQGRWTRCGAPAGGSVSNVPANQIMTAPAAPAVPTDRQNSWAWLIGRWTSTGDCSGSGGLLLREDGVAESRGQSGTWSATGSFGTYSLTVTIAGQSQRATAISSGADNMQLIPADGSAAMQLTRCGRSPRL